MSDTAQTCRSNGELRKSFNDVVSAAEELLRATLEQTNAEYHKARTALDDKLRAAKSNVAEHAQEITSNAKEIGAKGDRQVRGSPWISVGIGAGVVCCSA
jgi:ElaB/YqjD/DUF883 family membrane-anchored ribosome-binding protein